MCPVRFDLFLGCLAFLVFVFAWRQIPELGKFMNTQMWRLSEAGAPHLFVAHSKSFLALPRLLHMLALIYVLSCLPWVVSLCASAMAAPLRLMGQQGLEVFSYGTVLAMVFQAVMDGYGDPWILGLLLPPVGVVALYGIARWSKWRKTAPAAEAPSAPALG